MAPSRRKVRHHRVIKTKKSNQKRPKTRRKAKGTEEKIELEGITTYVYQKSFKPKPAEN
ncbi:MAG TPA: hypothetical protein VGR53_09145 [Nitrososphaerales archaeon]|nr:hypothetical protein [Nitrososphaerales archaeon]